MAKIFGINFGGNTKAKKNEVKTPFIELLQNRFTDLFSLSNREYLKAYRGWVYGCVSAIAQDVGNINIRQYETTSEGAEEVHESDLLDLLYKVNPQMTKFELFEITSSHLDLVGNAFWLLARDGTGKIKEIWPLRPDKVSIATDKGSPLIVSGYVYLQRDGVKIPLEAKDVLHFKNFNADADFPFPYRGMGVVEAASVAIDMSNFSHEWNKNFFANSATPNAILTYDGELSTDEYERLKKDWRQNYKGTDNAHKIALLKGGMDVKTVGFNQKEMDFVEQMRFTRDEILALFRVPKTALGIVEDVNRANAEATNYVFALRTIKPRMQKIIDTLNEFLVPEFGENIYLDFDSPVPADRVATMNEYAMGIDKWLTRNEIRAKEGLPPTQQGNSIFGNFTYAPIDTVVSEPVKSAEMQTKRRFRKKNGNPTKEFIDKLFEQKQEEKPAPEKQIIRLSEDQKKTYRIAWSQKIETNANPIKKDMVKFFEDQKNEVLKNVRTELKGLEPKEYTLKQYEDLLYDQENALKTSINLITPHLKRIVREIGNDALVLSGVQELIDLSNPEIQAFFEDRAKYFAKSVNDTTISALESEIADGIANGESINQISQRVENLYDGWDETRSTLIARTETSAAANFGAEEGYKQAGVEQIEWVVVAPEDEDCLMNENEIVDIGDKFPSGHTEPPAHPNCVCGILPVIER